MIHEVRLPKLGETMEDSQILEWVAKEGEKVKARQVLAVVETEKTSFELEAQYAGFVHIITPVEVTIPVGHLIATLADTQEEYDKASAQS